MRFDILQHVSGWDTGVSDGYWWGFDSHGQTALTTEYLLCEIRSLFLELVDSKTLP